MLWQTLSKNPLPLLLALFAASLPVGGFAQSAMPAALPEDLLPQLKHLLQVAVSQSPTMLSSNLDVVTAEGSRIQAHASLLPSVSGYGNYSYTESAVAANTSSRSKTNGPQYGLSFYQPLFAFGALKNQNDIGKLQLHIAERQYAEAYRLLVLSVRSQYLGLIEAKLSWQNQRFNLHIAESNLAVQEAKLRDGRISSSDITAPRLSVDEARITAEKAQEEYESSRRLLAHLVGLPDLNDDSIPVEIPKPTFAPETINSFFEEMKRGGLANVLMVQAYQDTIHVNDLYYKIAKVRLYPKFNVSASFNQTNQTSVVSATAAPVLEAITTQSISVGANWNLFDGFATRGAKMAALAARRLAEQKLKAFKEATDDTARSLEKQIGFAGRLMDLSDVRKELQLAAVTKVSNDVKSGVSPSTLLDSVTYNANVAQLAAQDARAEFLTKWASYVSLLGADPALDNLPPRYFHNGK
jgi:outer membrane protein TolC